MATSACLGSQVVNICLGLGMPWLIASATGHPVMLTKSNIFIRKASMMLLVDVILLVMVVVAVGPTDGGKAEMNRGKASVLIAWYIVSVGYLGYWTVSSVG